MACNLVYDLNHQIHSNGVTLLISGQRFKRTLNHLSDQGAEVISDHFQDGSVCEFIRLSSKGYENLLLRLSDAHDLAATKETGWLLQGRDSNLFNYWMPISPAIRSYDRFGRILNEQSLSLIKFDVSSDKALARFIITDGMPFIEFVIWRFPASSSIFKTLHSLSSQECQGIFLWGSHTQYISPKDLYQNLIHGAIYKNGWYWPKRQWKTAYCETDAHALYIIFHSLWKMTGKQIYQHMKTQLVFSVIARQDSNGAWRHGLWTDNFEVHYRLHCSGIHMLASDYEETKDPVTGSALKKAVDFLKTQSDELSVGTWYLHDSLELNASGMRKSPITFRNTHTLGKSSTNMLVLNTHLDALVALSRFYEVMSQNNPGPEITSGINATIAVLKLKPAEILYRFLFQAIELTFLSRSKAKKLPLPLRALRVWAWKQLIPSLPRIKKFFPRIVMPNGYIDRNLTLDEFCYPYFPINVMDLLRFNRRFHIKMIGGIINDAICFMLRGGLERWMEDDRAAYSLGFWAEAMYLDCLYNPKKNRKALADAIIALYDSNQGLTPSLLGCNSEYIPLENQIGCIRTENDQIRIVNLSTDPQQIEFLLINGTHFPQHTPVPVQRKELSIFNHKNNPLLDQEMLVIPARSWIRLLSRT